MIFAPYKLSTFKNHAKQLKRIAKNFGVRLSTMESLNLVARSFNAKSWNHLFLEHDTLSKCLYEKPNHPISNANIHFIEDLNFNKNRMTKSPPSFNIIPRLGIGRTNLPT